MATNLSSLIADAFAIYSESYIKIGTMGYKLVNTYLGTPLQPKKEKQLITCTMLFSVIAPALTLNDGGTAIVGVKGSIEKVNNLLLKLKRCVGLYDIPDFPSPISDVIINLDGNVAPDDATYITLTQEPRLTESRQLVVNENGVLEVVDNGPLSTLELTANVLNIVAVDASTSPMVLNMGDEREVLFIGSEDIDGQRTWQMDGISNARRHQFNFVIVGLVTPGDSTHDQTMPAGFKMSDARVVSSGPNVWRPYANGEYEAVATTYDGSTWILTISLDVFS
jgi:hypothetical protein